MAGIQVGGRHRVIVPSQDLRRPAVNAPPRFWAFTSATAAANSAFAPSTASITVAMEIIVPGYFDMVEASGATGKTYHLTDLRHRPARLPA
jgi:hypothetical protein